MNIEVVDDQDEPLQPEPLLALAEIVMRGEGLPAGTEVAFNLVDVARITELNATHMGKEGPTDVLSFPLDALVPGRVPQADPAGPPVAIGDVVICPEVVRSRATSAGVPFGDEMALMVVHGLLHLLGYDHVDDVDAEQMESLERDYLGFVGRNRP